MTILILSNSSRGLYFFRREVVEELTKKAKVILCVPQLAFRDYWEEIGCTFLYCKIEGRGMNALHDLKLFWDYSRILNEFKPDLVLTYTIKPNVYGGFLCALRRIPYIANITGLGTALENGGMLQKVTLALYRLGLRKAQKVFFQNKENRDFMLEHKAVKGAWDLLPGSGVNLQRYNPIPYPEDGRVRFVFISRIMKEKGIDQYLEAAESICASHENVEFHVYGFCEQQSYEERLSVGQKKGFVTYHGPTSNPAEVYAMASCTVHPTYYPEGMSNVLLESCACARPIITTDRAGCREIVDDGINGFVVRQKDSADLIEKIEKFLSLSWEERRQMGLAGRAKVEREFDREIVVQKYLNEIEAV